MEIKARTRYRTGRGIIEDIHSATKAYPEFMWSLGGNWYAREDGRFIHYVHPVVRNGKVVADGYYERNLIPTGLDLVEQVGETNDAYWDLIT